MARLPGVSPDKAPLLARLAYWFTRRKVGRVVTPVKIWAYHTRLLRAYGGMEMGLEASKSVPATLKCLAELRAASRIGCPF